MIGYQNSVWLILCWPTNHRLQVTFSNSWVDVPNIVLRFFFPVVAYFINNMTVT